MKEKEKLLKQILASGIIAIIRLDESEPIYELGTTLFSAGVNAIEVTIGTPNVLEEINKLSLHGGMIVGVGSVVDVKQAEDAIAAGAEYVVTPVTKREVINYCHQKAKPIFSGAYTPTEIEQAYSWGADVVKLFPAAIGGLPYFKAVKAPMPHIPIMPTGGITLDNMSSWLDAGAVCLGVGGSLVNRDLVTKRDFRKIGQHAEEMVKIIRSRIEK